MADARAPLGWAALGLLLCMFAMARPIDHDESQYVAAAVLTAHGALPYRDYAYLQTPLQPFLFAPFAGGAAAWPLLRLVNAMLGATALFCTWRAARLIASVRTAGAATLLFACCDSFLFSVGTARNDALPAACLAGAVWLAVRAEQGRGGQAAACATGLLLAMATATKVSYALPALAYGVWALLHRRHRPGFVMLGALPVAGFVLWAATAAPQGFWWGVFTFPTAAPGDYYADRAWKLSGLTKLADTLKFLALGPALAALVVVAQRPRHPMLLWLTVGGFLAALAPTPTWRQYLLPMLPPLFVLLAGASTQHPRGAAVRWLFTAFAVAGLAPTAAALASGRPAMAAAWRDGEALRAAMDSAGVASPVATLSPQFLPATGRLPDPRFATGPFWFRSRALAAPPGVPLLARRDLQAAPLPTAILVGGEGRWTSGDERLDLLLEAEAARRGYRRVPVARTRFRLWIWS